MPLVPKTRLGTYEILGPLGAGGMGEVYRAKDLRLGRDVAVKVLPAEVASSPDRLARFEREARTVAGLNHPNIVTLYSVEDENGVRFLTMELVEGQTLSTLVTPGGLPLSRILEIAIPLTDALAAAHERGVVHRDLKPGNVMVTHEGRVKVLDFGLAKTAGTGAHDGSAPMGSTIESPISREGDVLGTVPYMAPEQIRGEAVDARSDLFALGVILQELATGRRPFGGETSFDVGHSILHDTPEPLTRTRSDLPTDLERLVFRCLERSPWDRIQSAIDVSNELRRLRRAQEHGESERPSPKTVASIAVLPFVNRGRNEEDEYFSDGLADELLNLLAKIKGLRVSARASSFQFKGKNEDISVIGARLHVATLLDGSVRKAGNRVRISVQLIQVSNGYHLWSETYDRTLDDIFAVQDDIARSVVKQLRSALLGEEVDSRASGEVKAEVARAARGRGRNTEAHRLYLQARFLIDRGNPTEAAKGVKHLEEALELDPHNALAWIQLARAHAAGADHGWEHVTEGYSRAREAVEHALSLEPDLAEAHALMGWIQMVHDYNWGAAELSVRRAQELAPGNILTLGRAASLASYMGRGDEAIGLTRQMAEQDPLTPAIYHNLGWELHKVGRLAEAEQAYRKALELSPQFVLARALLSLALFAEGRADEALLEAEAEPDDAYRGLALAIMYHAEGRQAESDQALRELVEGAAGDAAYQIAVVHAARGEMDLAFDWLEQAYLQRDGGLCEVKTDPFLRSLHDDSRWSALLKRIGFAE